MEDKTIKCTQCGANLPKNSNTCEYCGCRYNDDNPTETKLQEVVGEGDIISKIGKISGMFEDMFDDLF